MNESNKKFNNSVHRAGRISTAIVIMLFIAIPVGVTIYSGLKVDYGAILSSTISLAVMMGIAGAVEKMSMTPIMGPAAVYVASSTGNVSNMKFPAAINAMNTSGYEQGTDKGEAVALIAVCSSAIVTTFIVFLGVIFLAPLVKPLLSNPYVTPAFNNMFPALLGAMATPFILKAPKLAVTPILAGAIAAYALGAKFAMFKGFLLPVFILLSIGAAYIIYKNDEKKAANVEKQNQKIG